MVMVIAMVMVMMSDGYGERWGAMGAMGSD
jgi:hypothetical protein